MLRPVTFSKRRAGDTYAMGKCLKLLQIIPVYYLEQDSLVRLPEVFDKRLGRTDNGGFTGQPRSLLQPVSTRLQKINLFNECDAERFSYCMASQGMQENMSYRLIGLSIKETLGRNMIIAFLSGSVCSTAVSI